MKSFFLTWMRSLVLSSSLAAVGVALVVPLTAPTVAHAKKKAPAKGKAKGKGREDDAPKRSIKKEEDLAPKKDVELDADISKTKDLKPTDVGGNRPTLTPEELARANTERMMDDKLAEEIELAKKLLELETECDAAAPVRFRLADLYWEQSKRAFFKANDFGIAESERKKWGDHTKKLQQVAIKNYQKIVDECEGNKDYAKTLFYLGKALAEMDRAKDGTTYFKRIIKEFPDSEWVADSWFMIGEYYFNFANDANSALKAYRKAAEYPKSRIFGFAVYKQGWCYINTGEWELAKERFKEVVTISEDPQQELDKKGRVSLRKEALRDYVRAYSNSGDSRIAFKTFYQLGGKDSVRMMMEQLGSWYINQGAHDDVIVVFKELIKNYAKATRLPVWQGRIVDATSRQNDKKNTVVQAKLLTDYFELVRERVKKNELTDEEKETITKDMKEAEDIAENTLRRLALEYHKEAKKLKGQAEEKTYRFAYELYKHYLTVFPEPKPDAEVNYVFFMRFYFAEVLYKLEDFGEAAKNYDMVVDMDPHPKDPKKKEIVLAAAEESVRSYDELVQDLDRKNPPEISGTEPKPIPEIKQKLIHSCKRYIDYVGSEGEKIVEIRYKMARIYYTYNHFDEAAPAFNDLVKNHPENQVACYSANLVLDIYNGKKDYKNLKESAHAYRENAKLACGDEDRAKFAKIEESSSFLMVKTEYEDKKKYVAAANAYLAFYKDFPKSEYADDSVYNAAVNYDLGNRLDKANEMRKFLVDKVPVCAKDQKEGCADQELVTNTLYNIAQSYERIVDFENAAQYLEQFATRFPKDSRSKDAVYNAALYRATLHDWAGGKAGRERYIKDYKDDPELYNVEFAICESLEEEAEELEQQAKKKRDLDKAARDKWEAAHNCYFKYIQNKDYVKASTDLLCQAQYRRGEIMRQKTNYEKGWQEQKNYLLKNWPTWKKQGVDKLPRCATAIAEIQFKDLEWAMKKYKDLTIAEFNPATEAAIKRFKATVASKTKARDELVEQYKAIAEIGVAEWALASLYQIGEAFRDSVQKLLEAPIPDKIQGVKLSAEEKDIARQQLKQEAAPTEAAAVEAYQICVSKANELGVYNKWSVRSLDQLNKLRPDEYPLLVERLSEVTFPDELTLAQTGVVVSDGDSLKAAEVSLVPGDGTPPKENAEKKEAAQKKEGGKKDAEKGKGKDKEKDTTAASDKKGGAKP